MTDRPKRHYLKGDARLKLAADLKQQYEAGATIRELAEDIGYSFGAVANLLYAAGTRMRPKGFQPKTAA